MRSDARATVAYLLCATLAFLPAGWSQPTRSSADSAPAASDLRTLLQKSYLDLFQLSPELHFTSAQFQQMREELKKGQEYCVGQLKKRASDYDAQLKQVQSQLKKVSAQAGDSVPVQLLS